MSLVTNIYFQLAKVRHNADICNSLRFFLCQLEINLDICRQFNERLDMNVSDMDNMATAEKVEIALEAWRY